MMRLWSFALLAALLSGCSTICDKLPEARRAVVVAELSVSTLEAAIAALRAARASGEVEESSFQASLARMVADLNGARAMLAQVEVAIGRLEELCEE